MKQFRCLLFCLSTAIIFARATELPALFQERLKSVAAVEFIVEMEIDRRLASVVGTVIDDNGTIILPSGPIQPSVAPSQLKDFKIYRPNSAEAFHAVYLGQDALTGWHFVRAEEKLRGQFVPITRYRARRGDPDLGEKMWGIGLRNKEEEFAPYLMAAHVGIVQNLPQRTAIAGSDLAAPGLPVFTMEGEFAGLALNSFGQNFLMFSRHQRSEPIMLVNVEESSAFLLADEVLPCLQRVPQNVNGRPIAWCGVYGLQSMEPDVARFLQLENQSGVVVSDIAEGSPAGKAGLRERDIVLAIDGHPLPRLKPDRIIAGYFGREILRRRPGDTLALTVLRGNERIEIRVTLEDEPKLVREAERKYFDQLGFAVREFLYDDSIENRVRPVESTGLIVHFVKPNSPAASAGLQPGDWVREIDGQEINAYATAVAQLAGIGADRSRKEFVLLVSRGGETSVLRVQLN
ncbi:MAG: PDZ domain-containing protein [Opitutaceae bacterium]|nr:PDZ domain-containing protein [Opitutaceae bacterium]